MTRMQPPWDFIGLCDVGPSVTVPPPDASRGPRDTSMPRSLRRSSSTSARSGSMIPCGLREGPARAGLRRAPAPRQARAPGRRVMQRRARTIAAARDTETPDSSSTSWSTASPPPWLRFSRTAARSFSRSARTHPRSGHDSVPRRGHPHAHWPRGAAGTPVRRRAVAVSGAVDVRPSAGDSFKRPESSAGVRSRQEPEESTT